MRTIKVKSSVAGLTKIPLGYPTGEQPTGVVNYAINGIPYDVKDEKALKILATCLLPKDRFEIDWSEVAEGKVLRSPGRPPQGSKAKQGKYFKLSPELIERLAQEENQNAAVEAALRQYFGI